MEDRERFVKCFVIIVERCKLWILTLVEKRIQQAHNGQTLEQFIQLSYALRTNTIVKQALPMSSSADLDISALLVVIQSGKLLWPGEEKSVGHHDNTTGDQVDRIRLIRNTFMHTAEANLDESDYDDYINDFKDIGKQFERINGEKKGTYTNQIEEIHTTFYDANEVERIVVRYNQYVEIVQRIEMSAPVGQRPALVQERPALSNCRCYHCRHSHPADCACHFCRHNRDNNRCQCYHCCHDYPNGCQCDDCQYKRLFCTVL